ncbi:MAG: PDZ domain-containing protein [Gemmatimonadales bacterium]
MRLKTMAVIAAVTLTLASSSTAYAQQSSEEARRERAERRADEARQQLEEAIRLLRKEDSRQARREMERAASDLRAAISALNRNRWRVIPEQPLQAFSITTGSSARMGVFLSTDNDDESDALGAKLERVVEGGPADEAGLEAGDIITKANGESLGRTDRFSISPGNKLIRIRDELEEGDTLHVEYRRGSETHTADIVLRELEPGSYSFNLSVDPRFNYLELDTALAFVGPTRIQRLPIQWLDIELVSLDEDLGKYFGTSDGLLVVRVPKESSLELKSGDVILSIGGRKPTSAAHALRIIRSYEAGETIEMDIMRSKKRMTVTTQMPTRRNTFRRRGRPEGYFFKYERQ